MVANIGHFIDNKPVAGRSGRSGDVTNPATGEVTAKVEFWAQDNNYGRRINCTLLGVMYAGEGERFGGGSAPASADDFGAFAKGPADASDVL